MPVKVQISIKIRPKIPRNKEKLEDMLWWLQVMEISLEKLWNFGLIWKKS